MLSMLEAAKTAALSAGRELMGHFRHAGNGRKYKKDHELVTTADIRANAIIIKLLKKRFPHHNIVSEEGKYPINHSDFCWYVDPLDGTVNYDAGLPLFAVNIGLAYKNKPILGVIYLPAANEMYSAVAGAGAFFENQRLHVSRTARLADSFIQFCHGYSPAEIRRGRRIANQIAAHSRVYRRLGCAGLEHANVAAGRADAIVIAGSKSWDNLAGSVLIREAGGRVTDSRGIEWTAASRDLVATNKKIHAQIINHLK